MVRKIQLAWLAMKELGPRQVGLYALYQLGLATGHYRRSTPNLMHSTQLEEVIFQPVFTIPARQQLEAFIGDLRTDIIEDADELINGRMRLFGGQFHPLNLLPPGTAEHWTRSKLPSGEDIKLIWEPARFGWVFTLGRAYILTGDERYPQLFWQYWEQFTAGNPVNCGPNWQSGQEVALRLIAYCYAAQAFDSSGKTSQQRKNGLLAAIADHADRIPPTLVYARAQHNNHLISEACGLYLAGTALQGHAHAEKWRSLGWKWLTNAFIGQIEPDGTYAQHSMNYHRMLLHLALLASCAARINHQKFPPIVNQRLAAASRWLLAQVDPISGDAPNLGHNDGANILSLGASNFRDHRPVGQAAAAVFLGSRLLPPGPWDELTALLGFSAPDSDPLPTPIESPAVRHLGNSSEWATLRSVHYHSRPAHADQLHVELWFNGRNLLLDPGTVAYSQPPIFMNSQVHSRFHNTMTIDNRDPMLRAGKFLWLRWDQAHRVEGECIPGRILTAEREGYLRLGVLHKRSLLWLKPGQWEVTDWVTPTGNAKHTATLQWLVPDGKVSLEGQKLTVFGKTETLTLQVEVEGTQKINQPEFKLVRGGKIQQGQIGDFQNEGWFSPTYLQVIPVYTFQVTFPFSQPLIVKTRIEIEAVISQ
ncbi:MAG TPA: alginate lyase family protein [Bellilinea sp.]|nr:alginate lyase family protein [Bellilinea sp.]